jgi:hypothetical protein
MTYPPAPGSNDPYGQQNPNDPYGQQNPYGQQQPDPYANPYGPPPGSPAAPQAYGQPQPPYAQPQSPYAQPYPAAAPTNTMAILSLVFAFVFAPLGIVFGHMAKKQIRERGEGGDGLATAGLVLGYIFSGIYLVLCCVYGIIAIAAINSGAGSGSTGY